MDPIYAVGDIHGQKTKLEDVLSLIEKDGGTAAQVVFLGDYVDRGPDSRAVIDLLAEGLDQGRNWTCLKGNHDRMFEWFLESPAPRHDPHLLIGLHWFHDRIGGAQTIGSYGVDLPDSIRATDLADQVRANVPDAHIAFLKALKTRHVQDGKFFVHAGVRPGVALDNQEENDLVWIRNEFLGDTRDHGALIVHGHTPVDSPDRRPNRVNLDTGAGYGRALSVAVFEGDAVFHLTPDGRLRLDPV